MRAGQLENYLFLLMILRELNNLSREVEILDSGLSEIVKEKSNGAD